MRTKPKQHHAIRLHSSDLAHILRDAGYDIPENPHYLFLFGVSVDQDECSDCDNYKEVSLGRVSLEWGTEPTEGGAE